ncbi:MAG: LacI family DNA-binding transcriptional regulator [Victivallales bacterium]|nr:LacI family DNA-binding transcriptional regulator [Victivallales bacterium]
MARKAGKVSIFTIAAELGISAATVSRVLNNRTGVGEATRCAVMNLAKKYNFRLNYPQQHQPIIATVISGERGISNYQSQILTGIYNYFAKHPYRVNTIVANPTEDAPSILETVREQQCSGVILIQPSHFASHLEGLSASGLPVMEIDDRSELPEIGFIDNDSYAGSVKLTEHLLSLGHRKIAFFMRWSRDLNHVQRLNGYRDTLLRNGVKPLEKWVVTYDEIVRGSLSDVARIMFGIQRQQAPDVTAIVGVNDDLAIAVMHEALKLGLRIPEQLSIAGFDDHPFCKFVTPELTTVAHPSIEAGFLAAKAIAEYISSCGTTPLPRKVLPTHLVVRDSTALPRLGASGGHR